MALPNNVVVHLADGKLIKGTTIDFNPAQPKFHVQPVGGGGPIEVVCRTMKALFFVKALDGRPRPAPSPRGFEAPRSPNAQGKKVAVLFKDGEMLCGYSLTFDRAREGFFVFPADSETNNLRVYVVESSVAEIKAGPEADTFASKHEAEKRRAPVRI